MQDTDATMRVSRRVSRDVVEARRSLSSSSLMLLSFSMYVSVRGNVGFGLVIVVVGNEVLHGVVGKELLELRGQLGRERLVVGDNDSRALDLLDDVGHGEGFAAAGNAQQGLVGHALMHAGGKALHRRFLIAHHAEIGY